MHSEQINELSTALSKVQGKLKGAPKDSDNPFFKSKYADLSSVWEACRSLLAENGLAVIQTNQPAEKGNLRLMTMLTHSSGQWISGMTEIPLSKVDPQGYGSAMTYARRYALAAIVGVVAEDDDAEGAMIRPAQQLNQKFQRPKQQEERAPWEREMNPLDYNTPSDDLGKTVINVGKKYLGKTFAEVGPETLKEFADDTYKWFTEQKKNISKEWEDFFSKVNEWTAE